MIPRPPRSTLFPTRRSSDLLLLGADHDRCTVGVVRAQINCVAASQPPKAHPDVSLNILDQMSDMYRDRKSTRLNSSHTVISYAVFCLKKKKYRRNALPHLIQ